MALTHEEKVQALIDRHVRDRNMDPSSIDNHYNVNHVGFRLDPEYFDVRLSMGWGFFKDEPRHLDHITRNMLISVLLAFRTRPGVYHQGKKAVMMGATYEQMMEMYNAGHIVGGGPVMINGMYAIRQMQEEGIVPGQQEGPWNRHFIDLGAGIPGDGTEPKGSADAPDDSGAARHERILGYLEEYYPDEFGATRIREDLAYGASLDPDFVEGFTRLAWRVYDEKPCYVDPIRREMAMLMILAYQGRREEVYIHTKKAMAMGAKPEQLLEAFEVGFTGGGTQVTFEGLHALRRIHLENGGE